MLKGAIYTFALCIFLLGCATKPAHLPSPSPPPEPLPDPIISETTLNRGGVDLIKKSEVSPDVEERENREVERESPDKLIKELSAEVPELTSPPAAPKPKVLGTPRPEVPEASPPVPDLAIRRLFLNPKKRLLVTVANIGNSPFPIGLGNLKIFIDGQIKESYGLNRLLDQSTLKPDEEITLTTPLTIRGRREVKAYFETRQEIRESNKENNYAEKILEGLLEGPDIAIRDLDITDDFELIVILSNAGEADLRSGVTLRVRVFVNGLKTSDFDHFTFDVLKANFGNDYVLRPPYQVWINGTAKVRISVLPGVSSDDIFLDNNRLERTFIVFPFRIIPREKQEFSFSVPPSHLKGDIQSEKLKVELRWDGGGAPLTLSFLRPKNMKSVPVFSGKSPIRVEFPIEDVEAQDEKEWKVFVTNLIENKVEGHLIIQHP